MGTVNQNKVSVVLENGGTAELYFSYETIVGVEWTDGKFFRKYISVNYWSKTTGKMLNKLMPDKTTRSNKDDMKMAIDACIAFISEERS